MNNEENNLWNNVFCQSMRDIRNGNLMLEASVLGYNTSYLSKDDPRSVIRNYASILVNEVLALEHFLGEEVIEVGMRGIKQDEEKKKLLYQHFDNVRTIYFQLDRELAILDHGINSQRKPSAETHVKNRASILNNDVYLLERFLRGYIMGGRHEEVTTIHSKEV